MSMPNGMKLEQAYEAQRTLLTTRKTERRGGVMNESFTYNERSELTGAQRGSDRFAYAYDNIGNRKSAEEEAESITYAANELNQYTRISTDGENFTHSSRDSRMITPHSRHFCPRLITVVGKLALCMSGL